MIKTLSPGEIARLCDVHQRTVSRWIASGKLKGHQLPGRGDYRVVESDFIAFAKDHGIPARFDESTEPTILVIDDEAPVRRALRRVLSQANYKVVEAENSFIAGAMLERSKPALITLDLMMPGIRSEQVFDFLRSQADVANVPVVVISAAPEAALEEARRNGATAVIAKPFNNDDLLACISGLIKSR
ncbi:MAG: response regulator [Saccharospirillum sp.]|uniref:response regulator n=1 Tax=Saccharospirillum sp. TaxID=2033801 RepID=UPI003299B6DD